MAVNWNDLVEKAGEHLEASKDLTMKEYTAADGSKKVYRDFTEISQLQTIARSQDALNTRDTTGIAMFAEMDYGI